MKILVTGSTGFLGRYVVAEALTHQHEVNAMVRATSDLTGIEWLDHPNLNVVQCDLCSESGVVDIVRDVDVVIHTAAAMSGDYRTQFAGTVSATENLLNAMVEVGASHIVSISSFAVYDYLGLRCHSVLTEESPLEKHPEVRHTYCQTKLHQENLVRKFAVEHEWRCSVIRPGAVYGHDHLWTTRLGLARGSWWLRFGSRAAVPLTYVENCAEAIVLAAEMMQAGVHVFNIVDDDPPTQRCYMKELQCRTQPRPKVLPVSWTLLRVVSRVVWFVSKFLLGGRIKVPTMLVPASLHASAKPLRYPNTHLKEKLNWTCRYSRSEALDRSVKT